MRIKEFAGLTGLTRDTIRFYERRGLLSPRASPNRYREYTDTDVAQVAEIQFGQAMGFSLSEIKIGFARLRKGDLSVDEQLTLMRRRLHETQIRIEELNGIRSYLEAKIRWIEAGSLAPKPEWITAKRSRGVSTGS